MKPMNSTKILRVASANLQAEKALRRTHGEKQALLARFEKAVAKLTLKVDRHLIRFAEKIPSVLIDPSIRGYLEGAHGRIAELNYYEYQAADGIGFLALPYQANGASLDWTEDKLWFATLKELQTFAALIGSALSTDKATA